MKDYKKSIQNLYALGCYSNAYWNPAQVGLEKNDATFLLSERSLGKTTAMLMLGMELNIEYGTIIHYIRELTKHLNRAFTKTIFSTIIKCGYVEKITRGEFNDVAYNPQERKWYYRKVDSDGIIESIATEPFMVGLSCDNSDAIKSSYVCSDADFIIVDEFCSQSQRNYFLDLNNIFSTLIREREDFKIVFLTNAIDRTHWIFDEFPLREVIDTIDEGDVVRFTTEEGMKFYIEFCYHEATRERKKFVNKHLFGYKNEKLTAIKGGGWQMKIYPRLPDRADYETISRNVCIQTTSGYVSLDLIQYDGAYFLYAKKRTKLYDDTIIYSIDLTYDKRKRFAFGNSRFDKKIWNMVKHQRIFYATNREGMLIDAYIRNANKERVKML